MSDTGNWIIALVALIAFWLGGFFAGVNAGVTHMQNDAIKASVAEWRIDPQTGEKSFHYKTPENP